jgi:transposase-like protein
MQEGLSLYIGREQYERTDTDSRLCRNGYYERSLVTQFGTIPDVKVPALRNASFKTKVFRRYKRYQDIVEDLVEDIFLGWIPVPCAGWHNLKDTLYTIKNGS